MSLYSIFDIYDCLNFRFLLAFSFSNSSYSSDVINLPTDCISFLNLSIDFLNNPFYFYSFAVSRARYSKKVWICLNLLFNKLRNPKFGSILIFFTSSITLLKLKISTPWSLYLKWLIARNIQIKYFSNQYDVIMNLLCFYW